MTTVNAPSQASPSGETHINAGAGAKYWLAIDRFLENAGEYLNPILVKETRQAFKSRQFAVTFALVLMASWLWSVLAIFVSYPSILYSASGPILLVGYLDILLFPLLVIIPFSAFRSLAAEREDGTFELLSISTITPRQIIAGKLVSSIVQMMVYLSALAPCIAFTYLLRGIDIITIGYVLSVVVVMSLVLSAFGLVLACITRQRQWQSALSVVVIVLYLILFISGLTTCYGAILESSDWRQYDVSEFWSVSLMLLSLLVSLLVLFVEMASAQITFESENRSAGVRRVLLAQHFLLLGWMAYWCLKAPKEEDILMVAAGLLGLGWFLAGMFINGETTSLSPRIKRNIPLHLLDRLARNWLLPGPVRGYLLIITSLINGVIIISGMAWINSLYGLDLNSAKRASLFVVGQMAYVAIYLGIGRMLTSALSPFFRIDIFLSAFLHIFLLLAGVILPLIAQVLMDNHYSEFPHLSNPFWFYFSGISSRGFLDDTETYLLVFVVVVFATMLFVLNLLLGSRQLVPQRETNTRYLPDNDPVVLPKQEEPDPLA